MPGCFFILSRFTLRVDNVLFRTFDTRIFHSFSSDPPLVIRETSGWEAPYDTVKRVSYILALILASFPFLTLTTAVLTQRRRFDPSDRRNVHLEDVVRSAEERVPTEMRRYKMERAWIEGACSDVG